MREPKVMRELHQVRERLSAEQKKLTAKALLARVHEEANAAAKKLGLKLKKVERAA